MATNWIYLATIWAIPAIIAITFHEASYGVVAHLLGDDTAWWLGRVSFNPLKHIDPVGTILLPGMLLLLRSPFLFGYAKPVPVNFRALRSPRRDMVLVAAAGPAMNIALAVVAALAFHIVGYLSGSAAQWVAANLRNALLLNVVLALFNLFPIPPLDGGRIVPCSRSTDVAVNSHTESVRKCARIAVGTLITGCPPHRTVRAQFRHTAPTLGA